MRAMSRLLCAAVLVLAACESPTSLEEEVALIELKTDRSVYAAGEVLTLEVTNRSSVTITYNFCDAELHRMLQGTWVNISPSGVVCSAIGYGLPPGFSAEHPKRLSGTLESGTYRYVASVSIDGIDGDERFQDLTSTTFTVQ